MFSVTDFKVVISNFILFYNSNDRSPTELLTLRVADDIVVMSSFTICRVADDKILHLSHISPKKIKDNLGWGDHQQ